MKLLRIRNVNKKIEKQLADLKIQIDSLEDSGNNSEIKKNLLINIENLKKEFFNTSLDSTIKNPEKISLDELYKLKEELEESKANLISQIENTQDSIWSVDSNLKIKTINSNFKSDYKTAFGVDLIVGMSVLASLPEPLLSVWKERYQRALNGEHYTIVDQFNIEEIPNYIETSFNPVKLNDKFVGVSCFSRNITDQKLNEEKFRKIFENSYSAISIQTTDEILMVNKAWANLTGYSIEEAKTTSPFLLIHPDSKETIEDIAKNRLKGKKVPNSYRFHLITKNKEEKWVDLSVSIIEYAGKNAALVVGNDITALHQLQERLIKNEANLVSLIENTDARIWSIDSKMNFVSLNSNFIDDYKRAFNIELREGIYALEGIPKKMADIWSQKYKKALNGEKFSVVEEFNIENIPQFVEISFNPVYVSNKVVGVTCFSRDISKQKIAQQSLTESEQRYKTLVTNIPSVSYRCALDTDWTMKFISEEMKNLSGYPSSDFINNIKRSYTSIIHPEDTEKTASAVKKGIESKQSYSIEYRIIHKNKSIVWVSERGRALFNNIGQVLWLDGVISDITKRKNTEHALKENEKKYRTIFNAMSDIYLKTNLEGIVELITPSIYDIFGYKPEEIIGKSISSMYKTPSDRDNIITQISNEGQIRDYETILIAKNGEEKTIAVNATLVRDSHGNPIGMEGSARDITLRKIAEQSLQERTKELNTIFDNAPVIFLLVDKKGNILNINKAGTKYSNPENLPVTGSIGGGFLNCINHYSSKLGCKNSKECADCTIRKTLYDTFKSKSNQSQIEGSLKLNKNGSLVTRHFLISTTYIDIDNKVRVLISLDDITEIKEAQDQIKKLSFAVEQSSATILITNTNGNIQYANPQFEKSTGYSLSEVQGENPRILKSNKKSSSEYKDLWQTITSGKTWKGEFLNIKKTGEEYWENAIISPTFNDKGVIIGFIAIKEDITSRKRIQEELIKSEKELRQLNDQKNQFISILAHDLRGLVGSYHAYSDLVFSHYDNYSSSDLKEQLNNLSNSSGEALKLLDNLLEWGKASIGNIKKSPVILDLKDEVETVINTLKDMANNKGVNLVNIRHESLTINTDPNILQTILRNLISNSIKFTPLGGEILVNYFLCDDDIVEISIKDTGIGMKNSTIEKLFKPDQKIVREGTNNETGTGLGLLICEEMVKRLGGKIQVESSEGNGSRFFFQIPTDI